MLHPLTNTLQTRRLPSTSFASAAFKLVACHQTLPQATPPQAPLSTTLFDLKQVKGLS